MTIKLYDEFGIEVPIAFVAEQIMQQRNEMKYCPFCNHHIEDRTESIYSELIAAMYRVMRWCEQKQTHEFKLAEVRHLLGPVNYARFGNLVHYGGVIYPIKNERGTRKRGYFGMNLQRAREVFANQRPFPMAKKYNVITSQTIEETTVYVKEIPALAQFINSDGEYRPEQFTQPLNIFPSKRGVGPVTK